MKVPVCLKSKDGKDTLHYVVPREKTIAEMMMKLRKHIKILPNQAMFIFVNGVLPPNSAMLGDVYDAHKSDNGTLNIIYSLENTFG